MNTLETIETRLAKKTQGLDSDKKKIENLNAQITQYKNSVERIEAGLAQKEAEVAILEELQEEAKVLDRRDGQLGAELEAKRLFYDQFEWSMYMPEEHKLESDLEYKKKLAERQVVVARLAEIEKIANKTYYRR
jgi:hypothetical protein